MGRITSVLVNKSKHLRNLRKVYGPAFVNVSVGVYMMAVKNTAHTCGGSAQPPTFSVQNFVHRECLPESCLSV